MNKGELSESVATSTETTKRVAEDVLNALVDTVQSHVKKGEKVTLPGFGTFERRARSARTGRNPRTGEEIAIKAAKVPAFKPGAEFKRIVSGR